MGGSLTLAARAAKNRPAGSVGLFCLRTLGRLAGAGRRSPLVAAAFSHHGDGGGLRTLTGESANSAQWMRGRPNHLAFNHS